MASSTLPTIQALVQADDVKISDHGFDELIADDISVRDVIEGISGAIEIEDYPEFGKGPSVLTLQFDRESKPIHVVWGIPKGYTSPAVLVTAYRPDPSRWDDDFMRRET
jgi:Domain of unknown function (DUF4258)